MSERLKEHDWKSCDGGDSSGGSNPLLCAIDGAFTPRLFLCKESVRKSVFPQVRASRRKRGGVRRSYGKGGSTLSEFVVYEGEPIVKVCFIQYSFYRRPLLCAIILPLNFLND